MASSKKKTVRLIIILCVAAAGIGYGIYAYLKAQGHETTDNAQLDATILAIRTSVAGYVEKVNFKENQTVEEGDVLLVIDSSDYVAKVDLARAALENAKAQLSVARIGATAAGQSAAASELGSEALKENITAAETRLWKARNDLERMERMFKSEAATQQQVDAARAEVQTAESQLAMAKMQYQSAAKQAGGVQTQASGQKRQIELAEALVEQRQAELELAKTQLANTVIEAPFDGIVSKKAVEPGQYLQSGQPVCSEISQENFWVTANFKETQFNELRIGQPVTVEVDAYPNLELKGRIASFGGATGARFALLPPDNSTGNFVKVTQRIPVRIELEPLKEKDVYLSPGMSVSVDVLTKQ